MLAIRDVMTRDVITVSPEHTLREAMELLTANHVTGAPVVAGRAVVGVISGTDLMEFAAALPAASDSKGDGAPESTLDNGTPGMDHDEFEDAEEDVTVDGDRDATASWFLERWRDREQLGEERYSDTATHAWTALDEHTVSEVMTRDVVSLKPDVSLTEAADVMRNRRLHRVLVMDGDTLSGILSTTDIVAAVADGKAVGKR